MKHLKQKKALPLQKMENIFCFKKLRFFCFSFFCQAFFVRSKFLSRVSDFCRIFWLWGRGPKKANIFVSIFVELLVWAYKYRQTMIGQSPIIVALRATMISLWEIIEIIVTLNKPKVCLGTHDCYFWLFDIAFSFQCMT